MHNRFLVRCMGLLQGSKLNPSIMDMEHSVACRQDRLLSSQHTVLDAPRMSCQFCRRSRSTSSQHSNLLKTSSRNPTSNNVVSCGWAAHAYQEGNAKRLRDGTVHRPTKYKIWWLGCARYIYKFSRALRLRLLYDNHEGLKTNLGCAIEIPCNGNHEGLKTNLG